MFILTYVLIVHAIQKSLMTLIDYEATIEPEKVNGEQEKATSDNSTETGINVKNFQESELYYEI